MQRPTINNIEIEVLCILYGLDVYHHYLSACEVSMIIDNKPLVAIFKKDVASISFRLQRILLQIYQYNIRILYKPGCNCSSQIGFQTHPKQRQRNTKYLHHNQHNEVMHTKMNTPLHWQSSYSMVNHPWRLRSKRN